MSERKLRAALGAARAQAEIGWSDRAAGVEAAGNVVAAEAALAAFRGEQYAQVVDLGVRWDIGAPLPYVVSNRVRTTLICHASDVDPGWDGTTVQVVSPSDTNEALFVILDFGGCAAIRFGAPNDEALRGHPLAGRGLAWYQAHEVHNSTWLAEHIRINSAHPQHKDAPWIELHHYFLALHDEMFEALARTVSARIERGTLERLLAQAVRDVVAS